MKKHNKMENIEELPTELPTADDFELAHKLQQIEDLTAERMSEHSISKENAKKIYEALNVSNPNKYDNRTITFVKGIFGKLSGHQNHDLIFRILPKLNTLYENAIPIYFEVERNPQKSTNIVGFQNYLSKVNDNKKDEYYVRITVQELTPSKKTREKIGQSQLHNTAISDVQIYKKGESGSSVTTDLSTSATTTITAFVDTKLQQFFEKAMISREKVAKNYKKQEKIIQKAVRSAALEAVNRQTDAQRAQEETTKMPEQKRSLNL
ncbi:hypothetical protein AGMMS4956_18540 [Bacteroidia bacterium]|nr:hypothetical protein AGMMS4956_18540 [Bacteroidia bacterium]